MGETPELSALSKEYDQRRSETIAFYGRYDKQTQVLTGYFSILALLCVALVSIRRSSSIVSLPVLGPVTLPKEIIDHAEPISLVGLTIAALIAFFFISNLMEIVHVTHLLQARSAALEQAMNRLLGGRSFLSWDSKLIPEFYEKRLWSVGLLAPSILVGVWALATFALVMVILTFMASILIPSYFWRFVLSIVAIAIYHVITWFWIVTMRSRTMKEVALQQIEFIQVKQNDPEITLDI